MPVLRIIAEKDSGGTWRAWFSDAPEITFVSANLFSAIDYLAVLSPGRRVDAEALFRDDERSQENLQEFLSLTPRSD